MPTEISGSTGVNKIQDNTIVNADINSSAAIAGSKLVMPTGSVLQVIHGSTNTNFAIGGATYADTGLSATITPQFSNSKIWIQVGQPGWISVDTTGARHVNFNICRGSTQLIEGKVVYKAASGYDTPFSNNLNWLDSPNTTSATTYKTQMKINNSAADAYAQQDSDSYSTITLMEIAG